MNKQHVFVQIHEVQTGKKRKMGPTVCHCLRLSDVHIKKSLVSKPHFPQTARNSGKVFSGARRLEVCLKEQFDSPMCF